MRKAVAVSAALIALVVVATAAYLTASGSTANATAETSPASQIVATVRTDADDLKAHTANSLIDASGIKKDIDADLHANAGRIASATGLSEGQVDQAIADLDVQDWQAAPLPAGARTDDVYPVSYENFDGTVTTYSDPSYVTVSSMGQSVTLAVPATAQGYVSYLSYL